MIRVIKSSAEWGLAGKYVWVEAPQQITINGLLKESWFGYTYYKND